MKPIDRMRVRKLAGSTALAAVLIAAPLAFAEEGHEVKGMIIARDGANMIIRAEGGQEKTVTLNDSTKVVQVAGALGLRRSELAVTDLIPGLPVTVETQQNGEEMDATKVTFKAGDLKTAQQVEAGTAEAKERVKAKAAELQAQNNDLRRRLSEANQYVEKGQATVLFPTGSSKISAEGQSDLRALAAKAQGVKGYLIGVVGYADTTGNAAQNQALSQDRADAVIRFLQQNCGVSPYRVMAADAMGESQQVGTDATAAGRAANRRVVVKIMTNKGLEGL
jgi:outer membrane protein OmpA-like peptidoglycan-associated protein